MSVYKIQPVVDYRVRRRSHRPTAFSLVELLTVVFIITLLIGILIPAISGARTSAKKLTTKKTIDTITVGLELFKNDNGTDFRQTNGYPPSFAHPKIPGVEFNAYRGEFPFIPADCGSQPDFPVVYGAHWLPAMLMGVDNLGYVKRSSVPQGDVRKQPWCWYTPDPLENGTRLDRMSMYLNPDDVRMLETRKLPGRPAEGVEDGDSELFPDWEEMNQLPVIVDAFDQPILYYVASTHGQPMNMLEDERSEDGVYDGGPQQDGVPYYFHQDNEGFTGKEDKRGWDFGSPQDHAIAISGSDLMASQLIMPEYRDTFARYIIDRRVYATVLQGHLDGGIDTRNVPLRPVNADTFLLISAGPDLRYGTTDDPSNLPPWPD